MKKTLLLALAAASLSLPALAEEGDTRIAVMPFAALSGDVPQRAGTKAAGMLSSELKNADGFALVDARPQGGADEPFAEELEAARAAVKEAQGLRAARKFTAAEQALTRALDAYREGAAGLREVAELQDAYTLLSAIQYNTGRDEEGAKSLALALALAPTRELPLAKTSPLFTKVVTDARAALEKAEKGQLLVEATPAGAAVTVDGASLGPSPLLVKDVPPGVHAWSVQLPSGERVGGLVQVSAKQQAKVHGQAQAVDPESKVIAALATNRIDKDTVEAARQQAQVIQADMMIFGALSRQGKSLVLDSFIVNAASGEVKRLPRSTFDTELLSAGMEFYNLVGQLAKEGLKVGKDTPIPGAVSDQLKGAGVKVAEVRYGQSAEQPQDLLGGPAVDPKKDEKRTPLEPKKKRKPLGK